MVILGRFMGGRWKSIKLLEPGAQDRPEATEPTIAAEPAMIPAAAAAPEVLNASPEPGGRGAK